ncbi:hypothetical protein [Cryobacterium sp. PH31-O1]|uniref:hypothetical protein n=1 Tax=Cryobacterium sp. PH31-O1 TaxID=3046306 RepID=UPI0024B95703|nr:hypothetical protein [Cryobacterium sp. PH31-O1]MDJ0336623.1 hypothetical protein [Cryobacterium sp. PH31-O1]
MDSDDTRPSLKDLPDRPARHFTSHDVLLIVGACVLAYLGGLVAGFGFIIGPVVAFIGGLMATAVRATRFGRPNEPALGRISYFASISVAVLLLVITFYIWKGAPYVDGAVAYLAPLVGVLVYLIYLVILFWNRRK